MPCKDSQKAANAAFREKLKRVDLQIPLDAWPMIDQYAKQRGLTVGACIKACLQECMRRDGYGTIAINVKQAKQANKRMQPACNDLSQTD